MEITITQYGGHSGSNAGDFAIVEICSNGGGRHVIVIDTGHSSAVSLKKEAKQNGKPQKLSLKEEVNLVTENLESGCLSLITSHRDVDHYDSDKLKFLLGKGAHWYHGEAVRGAEDWPNDCAGATYVFGTWEGDECEVADPNILTVNEGNGNLCAVDCWAPDWQSIKKQTENDYSLATLIYANIGEEKFSFLTLGDATEDAAKQLDLENLFIEPDIVKFPHHGSENNQLSIFKADGPLKNCKYILISGDSGQAPATVVWLHEKMKEAAIIVLLRTDEAVKQFKNNWPIYGKGIYTFSDKQEAKERQEQELKEKNDLNEKLILAKDVTILWPNLGEAGVSRKKYTVTVTGAEHYRGKQQRRGNYEWDWEKDQ